MASFDISKNVFISVKSDGNCLFNAISVALFGHENASSEIHLKTFFEMSNDAMFYARVPAKTHFSHQPHFCPGHKTLCTEW
jgi:hypothetical protein